MIKRLLTLLVTISLITVASFSFVFANEKEDVDYSQVLYCDNTGEIVDSDNIQLKVNTQIIAHLLTGILSVQKIPLDKNIKISQETTKQPQPILGLVEGKEVPLKSLIYGAVVGGYNDCAFVLGEAVSGNSGDFLTLMNDTLKNLKCKDTTIGTPTGVYDDKTPSFTTVKDILTLSKVAWSDESLRNILKKKSIKFPKGSLANGEEVVSPISKYNILGVESGMIVSDGHKSQSLGFYENNGLNLIGIQADISQDNQEASLKKLFQDGAKKVKGLKAIKAGENLGKVRVKHGAKTKIDVFAKTDGMAYIPKEGSDSLVTTKLKLKDNIEAPLKKGQVLGVCQIFVADDLVNLVDVISKEDISVGWLPSYLGISNRVTLITGIIIALIIFLLIYRKMMKIKRRRLRRKRRKEQIYRIAMEELKREEAERRRGLIR